MLENLHQQFELDALPTQCSGISVEKIPCCWVLSREGNSQRTKLNDTSMLIWQLCDGQSTVGEMIESLQGEFPDAKEISKDIHRALDELVEEDLIGMTNSS